MSVKLMGRVFELDIRSDPKFVLLAMADPAADDGSNSYLAVETIARKTSMSSRGVQQIIRRLLYAGYVEFVGKVHVHTKCRVAALKGESVADFRRRDGFGQGFTAEYRLTLDHGVKERLTGDSPAPDTPFGSQRTLQLDAANPALHDSRTQHADAKEPRTGCRRIKGLSVTSEPKEEAATAGAAQPAAFQSDLLTVNEAQDAKLGDTYPWVDRQQEYRKMDLWLTANRPARKVRNTLAFCQNWFNKIPCPATRRNNGSGKPTVGDAMRTTLDAFRQLESGKAN